MAISIHCPSAKSINLLYEKFWIPTNANLYIYNASKTHHIGGFTRINSRGSRENPGKYASGLVYGDKIILEYYEPVNEKGLGNIEISWIIHGYRHINIFNYFESTKSFGSSGDCQVNVNCSPEGDYWQDEKKSVALILVNGYRYCTGSLISNTSENGFPYLLTADHCLGGWANSYHKYDAIDQDPNDGIDDTDLSHYSFYWEYESPNCSDGTDFIPQSTSGADVIANKSDTDFALLALREHPYFLDPSIQVYFNGWDRGSPGQGGVCIHHPAGDIKKIATHNIIPDSSNCFNNRPNSNFWKINWISTTNGHSVTEGGSSGSPLYNSNHRVIGQLYGAAYCDDPNCSDPDNDIANYGKISISWNNDTDPRRRLKDWLDPLNTNPTSLDGSYISPYMTTSGTLPSSEFWAGTHTLTGNVIVPTGMILRLQSGATITTSNGSDLIINNGGSLLIGEDATFNVDVLSHADIAVENDFTMGSNVDFTVENGALMTIDEGVSVDFGANSCLIIDEAAIQCEDAAFNFTSNTGGITIDNPSNYCSFNTVEISNASTGLAIENCSSVNMPDIALVKFLNNDIGLRIDNTTATVTDFQIHSCQFSNNNDYGIYLYNSTIGVGYRPYGSYGMIENSSSGILCASNTDLWLHKTSVLDHTYGINVTPGCSVDFYSLSGIIANGNNILGDNTYGVYFQYYSDGNLGESGSYNHYGENVFDNSSYDIYKSSSPTVKAEKNC
ncbi:MAG: trypsin-like peptidase domain-containing protein [candidate division KSB1 bacterium]|nr:trypsin-like peptidase domain-containing protein [candidate division KSB1 bacterium]